MLDIVHRNPVAFFVAALLHLLLLTLLMVGVDWREKPRPLTSDCLLYTSDAADDT